MANKHRRQKPTRTRPHQHGDYKPEEPCLLCGGKSDGWISTPPLNRTRVMSRGPDSGFLIGCWRDLELMGMALVLNNWTWKFDQDPRTF